MIRGMIQRWRRFRAKRAGRYYREFIKDEHGMVVGSVEQWWWKGKR